MPLSSNVIIMPNDLLWSLSLKRIIFSDSTPFNILRRLVVIMSPSVISGKYFLYIGYKLSICTSDAVLSNNSSKTSFIILSDIVNFIYPKYTQKPITR